MRSFLVALLLMSAAIVQAQLTKLPAFGKVDKATLGMKECSFDKNAGAMIIFDEAESFFKLDMESLISPVFQQTDHRTRIKIFNKKGFDQADVKIRYRNDRSISIKNFRAQTYNLDAAGNIVVTKVDKSSVYDKQINKRYSERVFVFADIKEGSVIEYEYILDGASADVWYFQRPIPVEFSRFIVNFPQELVITTVPNTTMPLKKGKDKGVSDNFSWYTMEHIPALTNEPFMSSREDYLQRLEIRVMAIDLPGLPRKSLMRTWPGIIKELIEDEDFGKQLKRNLPRTADLDAALKQLNDPYQKMRVIHKYVRDNMEWNNYENIWAINGVRSAWKDKKGTSGEINLILINLLRDADLKVSPVLVSTRDNGTVNTAVAGYDQFNKVLAYVEIGNRHYVLDATERITPTDLIPLEVMASEGLVIEKSDNFEWGWKVLWDDKHKFTNSVFLNASIDEKGRMSGIANITSYDYEKIQALEILKKGKDKLQESKITQPGISIDSFMVSNADNDTLPLGLDFKFTASASSSGEYNYFSVNHFADLEKNPFVADERQTDIFYGALQDYTMTGVIYLPDGYVMEELPKNTKMITPDTSIVFKRFTSFTGGTFNFRVSLQFKSPAYATGSYEVLKEFFKKMYAMLNEKFVYTKK
ncbi:MAG TPA: DUF3857 domain-containing protein [Ferruginibacter sp.]|nr:DUF3857 domain-containing protein [Ferruginibacter sp.]